MNSLLLPLAMGAQLPEYNLMQSEWPTTECPGTFELQLYPWLTVSPVSGLLIMSPIFLVESILLFDVWHYIWHFVLSSCFTCTLFFMLATLYCYNLVWCSWGCRTVRARIHNPCWQLLAIWPLCHSGGAHI